LAATAAGFFATRWWLAGPSFTGVGSWWIFDIVVDGRDARTAVPEARVAAFGADTMVLVLRVAGARFCDRGRTFAEHRDALHMRL
jgi:hypothetical protein